MATIKQKKARYIYIIQCNEFYKIGLTYNHPRRLEMLQAGNPYELEVIFALYLKRVYEIERRIHEVFKAKRVRGEWFKLSEDDLSAIATILMEIYGKQNPEKIQSKAHAIAN